MSAQIYIDTLSKHDIPVRSTSILLELPEGPLEIISVSRERAFEAWSWLRAAVPATNHWPLLIGEAAALTYLEEAQPLGSSSEIVALAASLSLQEWLAKEVEQEPELFLPEPSGPWPESVVHDDEFHVIRGSRGRVKEAIAIALVPTADPASVPAVLRFGAWNACPGPEVHVAAFRQWGERFKAEPVSIAGDTVEFLVHAPPSDRTAAIALAREHYRYCTDIVDQGCETIEVLAATLLNDRRWFFWWD